MKNILIINGVNILLLIAMVIVYALIGHPIWFLVIFFVWIGYMLVLNVNLIQDNNPMTALRKSDKKHLFTSEIEVLEKSIQSVDFYSDIFTKYESGDKIRDMYDSLSERAHDNIDKATRWIRGYNYIANPPRDYILKLVQTNLSIVAKLSELNDLLLQVEDSTSDTDMSFVDDMLVSLKEMLSSDELD
ncbi:hypothetical protein J6A31_00905 [bacterium]|nr:hypothetical protein [bacterium]